MPKKDPQFLSFFIRLSPSDVFVRRSASAYKKISTGKEFKFGEFVFEPISTLFVGMIFYLLARGVDVAEFVAVGISATMCNFGTKALSSWNDFPVLKGLRRITSRHRRLLRTSARLMGSGLSASGILEVSKPPSL